MTSFFRADGSTAGFFPLFFEAAGGDLEGGAEFLGEEVDAVFFEHPAEGGQFGVEEADGVVLGFAVEEAGPEGHDDLAGGGIAGGLFGAALFELFQAEAHGGEVAWELAEPLGGRGEEEVRGDEEAELVADVGEGGGGTEVINWVK